MVRLKDWKMQQKLKIDLISIPYGAIKRLVIINMKMINGKFQFLMVRLKVFFAI